MRLAETLTCQTMRTVFGYPSFELSFVLPSHTAWGLGLRVELSLIQGEPRRGEYSTEPMTLCFH